MDQLWTSVARMSDDAAHSSRDKADNHSAAPIASVVTNRRAGLRFEIIGRLRGTVAAEPAVRVLNISRGGALIEAPYRLTEHSLCRVRLQTDRQLTTLEARVCHVRQAYPEHRFLIGLEFLSLEERAAEQIDRFIVRQLPSNAEPTW